MRERGFCAHQLAMYRERDVRPKRVDAAGQVQQLLDARVTAETTFNFVEVGGGLVTYGLAILLFHLSRPRRLLIRGVLAVAASWVVGIAYTAFVYNPAGIAAARANGLHFPEGHFDNNTIAAALVGGWIGPAIILAITGAFRAMREDVGLRSGKRTPGTSLDREREK